MNTTKYQGFIGKDGLWQRGENFTLLDMTVSLVCSTEGSAGFDVAEKIENIYWSKGHLDVHHPCPGHMKAYLRCSLPAEYLTFELVEEARSQVFAALEIPEDETYQAVFIRQGEGGLQLSNHVDREGMTNVMVTRKRNR